MLENAIKKYKIPKNRIPQVKKLFKITGDPKLSTYIVSSTKAEPHLVDHLIQNYKERSKKARFRDPGAIIYTMFKTIKLDYAIYKKDRDAVIPADQFDYFIKSGAVKIIDLLNAAGDRLIFHVVKDDRGDVSIIFKQSIAANNDL